MFNLQAAATERQAKYDTMSCEPFSVRVDVRTPIASALPWIPIDSVLAFSVFKDLAGDDAMDMIGGPADQIIPIPIPVARASIESDMWFYKTSLGIYEATESTARFRKHWDENHDDVVDFAARQPRVLYSGFHFKAWDIPMVLRSTSSITWFGVGNVDEISRLLNSYVTHIGKYARSGYGRVGNWSVSPVSKDYSCYIDGKPARPIPCETSSVGDEWPVEFVGYRPPYWAPQNQTLCYMP